MEGGFTNLFLFCFYFLFFVRVKVDGGWSNFGKSVGKIEKYALVLAFGTISLYDVLVFGYTIHVMWIGF